MVKRPVDALGGVLRVRLARFNGNGKTLVEVIVKNLRANRAYERFTIFLLVWFVVLDQADEVVGSLRLVVFDDLEETAEHIEDAIDVSIRGLPVLDVKCFECLDKLRREFGWRCHCLGCNGRPWWWLRGCDGRPGSFRCVLAVVAVLTSISTFFKSLTTIKEH